MLGNLKEFWNYANLVAEGLQRSLAAYKVVARQTDDRALLSAELAIAYLAGRAQDYRRSLESAERSSAIAERLGDASATATARQIAGSALFVLGDAGRAADELRASLEYFRASGESVRAMHAQNEYAWVLLHVDPERGHPLMLDALASAQTLQWPRAAAHITIRLAEAEFHRGHVAAALERARGAVEACRRRNSSERLAHALCNLCSYLSVAGEYDEARAAGREAATIARAHGLPALVEYVVQSLAIGIADRGDARRAAQLLGHVDAFMSQIGYQRERTEAMVLERLLERLRPRLEDAALDAELAAGSRLTMDEAIELALRLPVTSRRTRRTAMDNDRLPYSDDADDVIAPDVAPRKDRPLDPAEAVRLEQEKYGESSANANRDDQRDVHGGEPDDIV
jgi:tetratricopeptide (TPR) repeat protein